MYPTEKNSENHVATYIDVPRPHPRTPDTALG